MKVLLGSGEAPRRRVTTRVLWEPRDAWVGVFWNRVATPEWCGLLVYVCVVPFVPICFAWRLA